MQVVVHLLRDTECARDRSRGPRRARRGERTKGVEHNVVGVDGSETRAIRLFLSRQGRVPSGDSQARGMRVPFEKERKRRRSFIAE